MSSQFSSYLLLIYDLPHNRRQKVVLKTSSTSPVKLQLMIEGNHSDFQVCLFLALLKMLMGGGDNTGKF